MPTTPLNAKKIYVWGYGGNEAGSGNGMFIKVDSTSGDTAAITNNRNSSQRLTYNNAEEYTFTQNLYAIRFYYDMYDA